MLSTVTRNLLAAGLFAISTSAVATGSNKPPQFLTVPILGLRVELAGLKLAPFPEQLAANCIQISDPERYTSNMWIFGKAKDAASTYYILAGYSKWLHPKRGQRPYDISEYGIVLTMRGNTCGGDEAGDTFGTPDPNAENDGNVPDPILRELARDLAVQTARAFGGPDRLRSEIRNQRIDFNTLPTQIQEAFKPYFGPAK
jgi:hypothetical protein